MSDWTKKAVFYHIYPLGFCGTPFENHYEKPAINRIEKVINWIPHLKELGINAIYFGPLFEAKTHGYDTTDYTRLDSRLGDNTHFKNVCQKLHKAGIKVVVDGVFNHVGRDFFAFKDLQQNGNRSRYKDWFKNVNFGGRSPLGDDFYYEAWEGHFELVKLNLWNQEVRDYLFKAIESWIDEWDIDGIRLDVAYCLDESFLRALRRFVDSKKEDFWLMGEMIHGDYRKLIQPGALDSATNYECYKGIYSSHNDKNYFEINHSLNRLFAQGGLYQDLDLYNFVDNHDVSRIASILKEKCHINNVYTMLFTMPGIPSIYYGSEWQVAGSKEKNSDQSLRPELDLEEMLKRDQSLTHHIYELANLRIHYKALSEGRYEQVMVRNEQLIFARVAASSRVYVALNLAENAITLKMNGSKEEQLISVLGEKEELSYENGEYIIPLPAFSAKILAAKREVIEETKMEETSGEEEISVAQETKPAKESEANMEEIKMTNAMIKEIVLKRLF